jgi:hypothetical protein
MKKIFDLIDNLSNDLESSKTLYLDFRYSSEELVNYLLEKK